MEMKLLTTLLIALSILVLLPSCNTTDQPLGESNTDIFKLIGHINEPGLALSETSMIGNIGGFAVSDNYAYVAISECTLDTDDGRYVCNKDWLRVIDLSDPTTPVQVAVHSMPHFVSAMTASDGYIYVAQEGFGLRIWDTSNLAPPVEVVAYEIPALGDANSIALIGDYVYIGGTSRIWMLDVSDPTAPIETDFHNITNDAARSVLLENKFALIVQVYANKGLVASNRFVGSLQAMDVSEPIVALTEVCSLNLRSYVETIAISDNYVHIAYGKEGLQVIDISDLSYPTEIGFYNTPEGVWGVATDKAGDYLYVVDWKGAVSPLQFTSASMPGSN